MDTILTFMGLLGLVPPPPSPPTDPPGDDGPDDDIERPGGCLLRIGRVVVEDSPPTATGGDNAQG